MHLIVQAIAVRIRFLCNVLRNRILLFTFFNSYDCFPSLFRPESVKIDRSNSNLCQLMKVNNCLKCELFTFKAIISIRI